MVGVFALLTGLRMAVAPAVADISVAVTAVMIMIDDDHDDNNNQATQLCPHVAV